MGLERDNRLFLVFNEDRIIGGNTEIKNVKSEVGSIFSLIPYVILFIKM